MDFEAGLAIEVGRSVRLFIFTIRFTFFIDVYIIRSCISR